MFVAAVCLLFLLKLKWPKNNSFYDSIFQAFVERPNVAKEKQLQSTRAFTEYKIQKYIIFISSLKVQN